MKGMLFHHLALSKDKEGILKIAEKGIEMQKPEDIIKDPYVFEFLGIPRKALQYFGHNVETLQVGVHIHSFFGENSRQIEDEYYPTYAAQMNRIGKQRGGPAYTKQQFEQGRSSQGHLIIGDANEAVDKILHMQEMFGLTRFSAQMDVGGPSHESMMKSIEIFGTKIAPKVREALGIRATEQV
ncbi:hypothetical protein [Segetibacter koreensis]|uniref:hypothetical protein n=1 Tax=Segetibacter koreensis TaxID=398037 RepID=UPI00037A3B1A|nr:hypothetical protein [Segetibacter koreensis]